VLAAEVTVTLSATTASGTAATGSQLLASARRPRPHPGEPSLARFGSPSTAAPGRSGVRSRLRALRRRPTAILARNAIPRAIRLLERHRPVPETDAREAPRSIRNASASPRSFIATSATAKLPDRQKKDAIAVVSLPGH
jgi:hypothetical protein